MKTIKILKFSSLLLFVLLVGMTSCSKKIVFQNSSVVPAARGKVTVDLDKNANYNIKIYITNLAEVERLNTPNKTYVIWMQTDEGYYKNLGQLESSSASMSTKLKATFETVSAFKPVRILITAEDEGSVQYPGSNLILTTNNF